MQKSIFHKLVQIYCYDMYDVLCNILILFGKGGQEVHGAVCKWNSTFIVYKLCLCISAFFGLMLYYDLCSTWNLHFPDQKFIQAIPSILHCIMRVIWSMLSVKSYKLNQYPLSLYNWCHNFLMKLTFILWDKHP